MTTTMRYTTSATATAASKLSDRYTKTEWKQVLELSLVSAAYDGQKLVGLSHAHGNGPDWWIEHTIVHPDYRRQGIGNGIEDQLVEACIEAGATTIRGITTSRSHPFWDGRPDTRITRAFIGTRRVR